MQGMVRPSDPLSRVQKVFDEDNVAAVARIPELEELNIGHAIVSLSLVRGVAGAVRDMLAKIAQAVAS